jgi:FKBP-type peptidyl-prolyl cis-trans isomerase FklB
MKHTTILALLFVASAAFATAPEMPGKKKQKENNTTKTTAVTLATPSDSLSYAAGQALTRGLDQYITGQMKVDSTQFGNFATALREAIAKADQPDFNAQVAGYVVAQMLEQRMFTGVTADFEGTAYTIDKQKFNEGFIAAVLGDSTVMTVDAAEKRFKDTRKAEEDKKNAAYKLDNELWLQKNAKNEGVNTLPSGLQYKVIKEGNGAVAKADDNVTVRYEGHTIDGNTFDSSYKRTPDTTTFRPNQVIKGWTEALCMMPEGSKWVLYIPQDLAYGSRQAGQIKPYSTLVFTVEVVKVEAKKAK